MPGAGLAGPWVPLAGRLSTTVRSPVDVKGPLKGRSLCREESSLVLPP